MSVISPEYLSNNKPVSLLEIGFWFNTKILSENAVLVPDTLKLPPTKVSFLTEKPPSTLRDPPDPTPTAFVESKILIGLL